MSLSSEKRDERSLPILSIALLLAAGCASAPAPTSRTEATALATPAEWDAFLERLAATGREIFREGLPADPEDRAAAHRYLLQRLSASIDEVLEAASEPPVVALYSHKLRKYGMDSADGKYSTARIDSGGSYRVYGRLGTAHHIALQLVSNREGYEAFDSLALTGMRDETDEAGTDFELRMSAERPSNWSGPWLRLDPKARELLFREYFYDWERETPSEFYIERLDDPAPGRGPRAQPEQLEAVLDEVASTFAATVPKWFGPSLTTREHLENRLAPPVKSSSEGIVDNAYGSGWFRITEDDVLLIELEREPTAHLWSFELGDFWWQSIDYVNHTSSLNGHQAHRASDGRYYLVVALEDPGVPNWLDPAGHREGTIIYRYQLAADDNPVPDARLVERDALRSLLPRDTPIVTPAERRSQIELRRRHAARRWAP